MSGHAGTHVEEVGGGDNRSDPKVSTVAFYGLISTLLLYTIVILLQAYYWDNANAEIERKQGGPPPALTELKESQLAVLNEPQPIPGGSAKTPTITQAMAEVAKTLKDKATPAK